MSVKLKDIKGVMIEGDYQCLYDQSEVKITLSREKLAKALAHAHDKGCPWDEWSDGAKRMYLREADSIIQSLPDIIEREE